MYILTEGLPGCSGWGCPHKGCHFQVHPHVCAFQATIVILHPVDLYAGVIKCSHAVSESLVISLVGTISNYFSKLIANQHLTKTLCEPVSKTTHSELRSAVKANMTSSKTTSLSISFLPPCSECWGGDPVSPTGGWCWKCSEREGAFDVSTARILPPSSRALGLSDQSWSITAESRMVCQKKEEILPERKLMNI